jgi:hypothetical protein
MKIETILIIFCMSVLIASLTSPLINRILKAQNWAVPLAYILILIIVYGIGLLPISTYREGIDIELWTFLSILLIFTTTIGFGLGRLLNPSPTALHQTTNLATIKSVSAPIGIIVIAGVLAGWASAVIIIFNHGAVIINQQNRFAINQTLLFLIETSIPLSVILIIHIRTKSLASLIFCIQFLAVASTGYRNTLMLFLLIFSVTLWLRGKPKGRPTSTSRSFYIIATIIFAFAMLYQIRIETDKSLYNWEERKRVYKITGGDFVAVIFPLHWNSRENLGVADSATKRAEEIDSFIDLNFFLLQDIYSTIMPGKQMGASEALGIVVNRNHVDALTISALGGGYLSYGTIGVIVMGVFTGLILHITNAYARRIHYGELLLAVVFLYLLALHNRGVPKLTYITSPLIVLFISILSNRYHQSQGAMDPLRHKKPLQHLQ